MTWSDDDQRRSDVQRMTGAADERVPVSRADDHRWFSDEVAIDFPSISSVVARIRRAFLDETHTAPSLQAEIVLSRHEAWEGVSVPLEVPLRSTCPLCGGRGETWMEPCVGCRGSGESFSRHRLRVSIPAGVTDGTRFSVSVGQASTFATRIEVRIAVRAPATS
jgi:hypothetical protein